MQRTVGIRPDLQALFHASAEPLSPKTSFAGSHAADDVLRITGIDHIESIDLVFESAADGCILQALSSLSVMAADPVLSEAEGTPPDSKPTQPEQSYAYRYWRTSHITRSYEIT